MPYDPQWLRAIPMDSEMSAYRLRGLSYLCTSWSVYRREVGDPGPEGEDQVMEALAWALRAIAVGLEPPEGPTGSDRPGELLDPDREA